MPDFRIMEYIHVRVLWCVTGTRILEVTISTDAEILEMRLRWKRHTLVKHLVYLCKLFIRE